MVDLGGLEESGVWSAGVSSSFSKLRFKLTLSQRGASVFTVRQSEGKDFKNTLGLYRHEIYSHS